MTAENGFNRAPLQSTATSGPLFTEQEFSWEHTEGITGSGSLLIVLVGSIDSSRIGKVQALSATFSGAATQAMTLSHELIGTGRAFPSIHIFTLASPGFSGVYPSTSGIITVRMNEVASNAHSLSIVLSGTDTASLNYLPGTFIDRVEHNITAKGTLSGSLSANTGDLLLDCVLANAGRPDSHTLGPDQILIDKVYLNSGGSAAMSVSMKFASTAAHTKGMFRSGVTALETVSETKFVIRMH